MSLICKKKKTKKKTKITQEYSMKMNKAHVFVKK